MTGEQKIAFSCVSVSKLDGQRAINILKKEGNINTSLKIKQAQDMLLIPVFDPTGSLRLLLENGVNARECVDEFVYSPRTTRREILNELREKGGLTRLSYHLIGDIIVINLKGEEEVQEAKLTASVLMSRLRGVRSVYGKLGTFDELRLPRLIHLAGEEATFTIAKEYGIRLAVDISKAFYNPRLSDEHRRVALEMKNGSSVLDMFSGVGGFCLHIATSITGEVHCNDINPVAVSLLSLSVIMNSKRLLSPVYAWNVDARKLPERLNAKFDVIIMNHPTGSLEFLDAADRLLRPGGTIYLYVLGGKARETTEEAIEGRLSELGLEYETRYQREVLEYSPSKSVLLFKLVKTGEDRGQRHDGPPQLPSPKEVI